MLLIFIIPLLIAVFTKAIVNVWAYALIGFVFAVLLVSLFQLFLLFMILGINVVRFGFGGDLIDTSLIRVTTEAVPQGSWEVELFPTRGFAHSEIYEDLEVGKVAEKFLTK